MKISYISKSKIPSMEANSVHVMKMCQAFKDEGHDVTLFAPRSLRQKIDTKENLKSHYGVKLDYNFHYSFSLPKLRGYDYIFKAVLISKIKKYEAIYSRYLEAAYFAAIFGCPVVFEAHAPVQDEKSLKYFNKLINNKNFKKIVVISEKLKNIFIRDFHGRLDESKIIVAHDGVDLERFIPPYTVKEARTKIELSEKCFIAGYSGHLYPGRGIELIIQIAEKLKDIKFMILGGDQDSVRKFKKEVSDKRINNVVFMGFINNRELSFYLQACDVLLMPYQKQVFLKGGRETSAWMSPMKMFEYMATNRPLIGSDLPVLREVLNNENCILVDSDDVNAWLEAIITLRNKPEYSKMLAGNARQNVEHYTWRIRVKIILKSVFR